MSRPSEQRLAYDRLLLLLVLLGPATEQKDEHEQNEAPEQRGHNDEDDRRGGPGRLVMGHGQAGLAAASDVDRGGGARRHGAQLEVPVEGADRLPASSVRMSTV